MATWENDLLGALLERDKFEKVNQVLYQHYSKLASKVGSIGSPTERPGLGLPGDGQSRLNEKDFAKGTKLYVAENTFTKSTDRIRQELSEAQRSRGVLDAKLKSLTEELQKLQILSNLQDQRVNELSRVRDQLLRRVKDRDEEIRGKSKLLDDVHDENLSLTLQLNLADERSQNLEAENKQLVERWMKRMSEEADHMNEKSKFS